MATISGDGISVYLDVVTSESESKTGKITTSPIEGGGVIADHFSKNQTSYNIQGYCVNQSENKASNLRALHVNSAICNFVGRIVKGQVIITSLNIKFSSDTGFNFTMTLTEVRISSTAEFTYSTALTPDWLASFLNPETNVGTQQASTKSVDSVSSSSANGNIFDLIKAY